MSQSHPDFASAKTPASQLETSQPLQHEQRTLVLTIYRSSKVPNPSSIQESVWTQMLGRFRSHVIRPAKDGAAFSFLRLKPGTTRANENVESHSAVVLDIDDGTPLEEIVDQVREYEFLAVSTHSHTQEHAKYRMIFPLSRDVPTERWPQTWQIVNRLIGDHADPATKDSARIYFFPSAPAEHQSDTFFHHNPGKWLDPDELLTPRAIPRNDITRAARSVEKGLNWEFEVHYLYPAADVDRIAENCAQLREMRDLGGRISEPRWFASLGVLVHTENGEKVAHAWSSGDPRYTHAETERRLARLRRDEIGPTTCERFADLHPEGCASCEHKGKIKSPIRLGYVQPITPAANAPTEPVAPPAPGVTAMPAVERQASISPSVQSSASVISFPTAKSAERLFDLSEANVRDFLTRTPSPRRYLLKDCLPVGKVGAIIAPGGTGKSQFVLQIAISIASGLPLAGGGWEVGESGGVLALFAEDDSEEVHRRLHNTVKSMGSNLSGGNLVETLESRLFVRSMVAEDNLMTVIEPIHKNLYRTPYAEKLIRTAQEIPDLKLIIIDPASRFRGGNENAAEDMTRFVECLEYVSKQTGTAVLVVHHANKASMQGTEQTQSAARGSSAFSDGVRWQMNLSAMTKDEAKAHDIPDDQRHLYLSATMTKNNYAAPQPPVFLRRAEGGVLLKADLAERAKRKEETTVLEIVQKIAASDERFSARSFSQTFGGKTNIFSMGQNALTGYVNRAIENTYLEKGSDPRGLLCVTALGKAILQARSPAHSAMAA